MSDSFPGVAAFFGGGALAVGVWVLASLLAGGLLGRLSRGLLTRLAKRTKNAWDDQLVTRLGGPLTIGWTLAFAFLGLPWLRLTPAHDGLARRVLGGILLATVFWVGLRFVDVAEQLLAGSAWATSRAASRSFIGLASRATKVAVVVMGVLSVLSHAGYQVGTLVAGLGIGGLALALGAQKTLENVFGAFSLAADEPFHIGDFVKIDAVLGTVESIGLRSTRIRTLDRTLVAIPNGKLAEMRTESYAARDRLRLEGTVSLVYQTTAEQMRRVLAGLEAVLRAQPKVWPEAIVVRFKALGPSSLDIDIMAWFTTTDWGEFQLIRQEILLRFMEVVAAAGTSFAHPTRTIHLVPPGDSGVKHAGESSSAGTG
jgi:MscS family membrane protein